MILRMTRTRGDHMPSHLPDLVVIPVWAPNPGIPARSATPPASNPGRPACMRHHLPSHLQTLAVSTAWEISRPRISQPWPPPLHGRSASPPPHLPSLATVLLGRSAHTASPTPGHYVRLGDQPPLHTSTLAATPVWEISRPRISLPCLSPLPASPSPSPCHHTCLGDQPPSDLPILAATCQIPAICKPMSNFESAACRPL